MNRRFLFFTLAILLLAAASTWLMRKTPQEVKRTVEVDRAPDYFIRAFTVTEMGKDGRPLQRLRADSLTHYPGTRTMELERPHLTFFRPAENPWQLHADHGHMEEAKELVTLSGGVRLVRVGPDPVELTMESVNIYPEQHYAETADPLTFKAKQGTVKAVGMEAFLADERVVLRSQVRGHYAP